MAKPEARFRILGEDATAVAFRSVLGNAQSTANKMQKQFSMAFQALAGFGIANGIRRVIRLNIDANEDFARSVENVKTAFTDLFTMDSSGLSETTEQMNRLADTLRDPAVQDGADKLVSALAKAGGMVVTGWALLAGEVASTVESIREGNDELDDAYERHEKLSLQIAKTMARMKELREENREDTRAYREANAELHEYRINVTLLQRELERLRAADEAATPVEEVRVTARRIGKKESTGPARLEELAEVEVKARRIRTAEYFEDLNTLTQTATERQIAQLNKVKFALDELFDAGLISAEEWNLRWGESLGEVIHEVEVTAKKIGDSLEMPIRQLPDFALQAADDSRYAFEEFFFDPTIDGIKGLGRELVDTLRRSIAQGLGDTLFGSKSSGGLGWGDAIAGFVSGAFGGGRAKGGPIEQGKWYIAGEKGPEPIWGGGPGAYAMGYGRGGGGNVTINVDARGAQEGVAKQLAAVLPAVVREAVNQSRSAVMSDLDRRGMSFT